MQKFCQTTFLLSQEWWRLQTQIWWEGCSDLYADSAPLPIQHPCWFCTLQARASARQRWGGPSQYTDPNHELVVSNTVTARTT